ncbi:MAG: cytochrome c biogenesis protein CcsA [Persicimonas sp.]
MTSILDILEFGLPLLYAASFALYFRHFLNPQSERRFYGPALLKATLAVHAGYLVTLGVLLEHFPIATRAEFLSVLAISIAAVYAFVETRHEDPNTGVFFLALVFSFQLASSVLMVDIGDYPEQASRPVFAVHVIFTVLGFAALSLSALYALMYVLLARQLKSHELGVIFERLPSLATLENMSKLSTVAGVVLLGLGLALGHWVAFEQGGSLAVLDPVIVAADLIWLAYFIGLIVASVRGLSGLRMGYLSVIGYVALIGTVFAIMLLSGAFHSFS